MNILKNTYRLSRARSNIHSDPPRIHIIIAHVAPTVPVEVDAGQALVASQFGYDLVRFGSNPHLFGLIWIDLVLPKT